MLLNNKERTTEYPSHGYGHNSFGKKVILTLFGVLLVYLTFYIGALMRNAFKEFSYIGIADGMERTITVTGFGEVSGSNDIAITTLGFSNVDKDVSKAQKENNQVMDQVFAALKELGIEDDDLQTNYNVHPEYNYTQGEGRVLQGYRVSNSLTIKVRDLTKTSEVLGLAGRFGANQASGLNFTIDDAEDLKAAAREKALLDAKKKAVRLANSLGVKLVELVAYHEGGGVPEMPFIARAMSMDEMGMGGASLPPVASGSQDVSVEVSVTYRFR